MSCKAILCSVLVAYCIGMSIAATVPPPSCNVTDVGNGLEEEECGDRSVLRYTNGTVICTERELFENQNLWVLELNDDVNACYVISRSEFPDGIDYTQYDKDETAEEADDCQAEVIRSFVPECEGRTIYNLTGGDGDGQTVRRKRQTRICVRCLRLIYRNSRGQITRIRVFCFLTRCPPTP